MKLILNLKFINLMRMAKFSNLSDEVILKKIRHCGVITLNRPKALNSLNKNMVDIIYPILSSWADDKEISHVIIEGSGDKAFCAGGDIIQVTKEAKSNIVSAASFFKNEYKLNFLIGSFSKPYIAFINGITMGGGFGLSVHGKYRIATEKTVFAMPETAIGLFPDVGGGYFLPRLPKNLGIYVPLVGTRFKGEDVVLAGVATHYVDSQKIAQMKEELVNVANDKDIERILHRYSNSTNQKNFSLATQIQWIEEHFSLSSIEEIIKSLSLRTQSSKSEPERLWSQKQVDIMGKMSPTSLKITLRQLQEGRKLKFRETFTMEYRMAKKCLEKHDFHEGVRALLIDKDNTPKWKPSSLADVTNEMVDEYFKPVSDDLVL